MTYRLLQLLQQEMQFLYSSLLFSLLPHCSCYDVWSFLPREVGILVVHLKANLTHCTDFQSHLMFRNVFEIQGFKMI